MGLGLGAENSAIETGEVSMIAEIEGQVDESEPVKVIVRWTLELWRSEPSDTRWTACLW